MSVIRVGFVLAQVNWLGGVNYFRNLFLAIQLLPDAKIRPVVFAGLKSDVSAFEGIAEIVRTPVLDRKSLPWMLSRFADKIFPKRDYVLYQTLKKHQIDILSHFGELWRGCSIPSIGWIPDFQHVQLPHFFTQQEITQRNKAFLSLINRSSAVLLSSENALNDLKIFCPQNTAPTYVLRFTSCVTHESFSAINKHDIQNRYGLNRSWFHVPNQFWAHKNHGIIIEALHRLKQQGKEVLVVATGSTDDYRNPEYFVTLQKKINDSGLAENFKILGILPYNEVISLMRYSVAVINPSLFEGWSTTVEEAKSLGKKILLSDISVHREQAPQRVCFFKPDKADELAEEMMLALKQFDPIFEEKATLQHQKNNDVRLREFAKIYESIVLQVYAAFADRVS
jgi:glycosyltransferase involved in cell wall biosynthesis